MAESGSPTDRRRHPSVGPDTTDSGLEDEPLTSSAGDLRSLGRPDGDLGSYGDLEEDEELTGLGRGLLEVPVENAVLTAQNAAFTAQLRQFLRAVRSPQQRRRAAGACGFSESPLDGSSGGSRSPIDGRLDASELEFDWWAGQFSICGAELSEADLWTWCLETNRKVRTT